MNKYRKDSMAYTRPHIVQHDSKRISERPPQAGIWISRSIESWIVFAETDTKNANN